MIVPGGGISLDGERWVACRPSFLLPVRVLSRLFRRLFLERLIAAHKAGHLKFFGNHAALAHRRRSRPIWLRYAEYRTVSALTFGRLRPPTECPQCGACSRIPSWDSQTAHSV
jgi:hypothetical protein